MPTDRTTLRHRWRTALRIERQLRLSRPSRPAVSSSPEDWQRVENVRQRLEYVLRRGWRGPLLRVLTDLDAAWDRLVRQGDHERDGLHRFLHRPPAPDVRDINAELAALEQEFDTVHLRLREQTISVETPPILLDEVYLGPFEIRLHCDRLGGSYPYEVIPLRPHPAASDDSTPHPHVRNQSLCEGEGQNAIRQALTDGRLCEFFLLVRQVLDTYNPDNAYISLDHWHGRECHDCGGLVTDDDATSCELCGVELCYECSAACRACERACCSHCWERCPDCEEVTCERCLDTCEDCNALRCPGCLTAGRCRDCPPLSTPEETDASVLFPAAATPPLPLCTTVPAAVHTRCLGQAAVPA